MVVSPGPLRRELAGTGGAPGGGRLSGIGGGGWDFEGAAGGAGTASSTSSRSTSIVVSDRSGTGAHDAPPSLGSTGEFTPEVPREARFS